MQAVESDRRPTIRDVAQTAGVSMATVSNVVNGHAHVRQRTRGKVLDAIDQLGYQASRAAKSLPAGRTFMLAYCLHDDARQNPALDVFLHQIVSTAASAGLELILTTQAGSDRLAPYVELVRRGGADGFVLSGIEYHDERVTFLRERNIPVACFGRVADSGVPWIDVDGAAGVRASVGHLIDQGRSRISFVGWQPGPPAGDARHAGFTDATIAAGLRVGTEIRVANDFDEARKAVAEQLEGVDVDALVCVSDTVALGAMAGLRDLGLIPGADVAVTGFDDVPAAALTVPGLTSLRQPMDRVGALLVERIIALLTGEDAPESVLLEPDLIVRESTTGTPHTAPGSGVPLPRRGNP